MVMKKAYLNWIFCDSLEIFLFSFYKLRTNMKYPGIILTIISMVRHFRTTTTCLPAKISDHFPKYILGEDPKHILFSATEC